METFQPTQRIERCENILYDDTKYVRISRALSRAAHISVLNYDVGVVVGWW